MDTHFRLSGVCVLVLCSGLALAGAARAESLQETLMSVEKTLWKAWAGKDVGPFEEYLTEDSVNVSGGSMTAGKARVIETATAHDCNVVDYSFSDVAVHPLGADAAILTYRAAQDATCGGEKIPPAINVTSVYVKEGGKWKAACYHESPAGE